MHLWFNKSPFTISRDGSYAIPNLIRIFILMCYFFKIASLIQLNIKIF